MAMTCFKFKHFKHVGLLQNAGSRPYLLIYTDEPHEVRRMMFNSGKLLERLKLNKTPG